MGTEYIRNRTVLVTGSTDGIGLQTALELARMDAKVIIHGRSEERLNQAFARLRAQGAEPVGGVVGDYASFESVQRMADEVRRSFSSLSVLINNAGIYMNERELTQDGHEMTWQVNHLSMVLLTELLLSTLGHNAPSRIVNVASIAHTRGSIDLNDLDGEKTFDPYGAYAQSKLANIMFTYELADRIEGSGVTANCLHPGVIGTKLLRQGFGIDGGTLKEGAETSVYLASDDDLRDVTGKYFVRKRETASSAETYDEELRKKLWETSREQIYGE